MYDSKGLYDTGSGFDFNVLTVNRPPGKRPVEKAERAFYFSSLTYSHSFIIFHKEGLLLVYWEYRP